MPSMRSTSYAEGASAALRAYNVRVAAYQEHTRMPDGPEHLGAEWLARQLSSVDDAPARTQKTPAYRKLEKPPIWGPRASLESSTANARNYSGIGAYGGV